MCPIQQYESINNVAHDLRTKTHAAAKPHMRRHYCMIYETSLNVQHVPIPRLPGLRPPGVTQMIFEHPGVTFIRSGIKLSYHRMQQHGPCPSWA